MIPDLNDLAGAVEAEDVDARKAHPPSRRRDVTPGTGVRARSGSTSCDEVAVTEQEVDMPLEIWERSAEVPCDLRLPLWPGRRTARSQVVPDVLLGEDLASELEFA